MRCLKSFACFLIIAFLLVFPFQSRGGTDPYQVVVWEHPNFNGSSTSWKLEPGMRYRLVSRVGPLNDRISSIQVGSMIKVAVYKHAFFRGSFRSKTF
jgi:hypothetical protein